MKSSSKVSAAAEPLLEPQLSAPRVSTVSSRPQTDVGALIALASDPETGKVPFLRFIVVAFVLLRRSAHEHRSVGVTARRFRAIAVVTIAAALLHAH